MPPLVSLQRLTKAYANSPPVLEQLQLELAKGEFLYVLGGTGAGKSSLLRLMATEELATRGSVSLFGYDVASASASTLRAIRQAIGFVPQNVRLIPDMTVLDNVALSISLAGRRVIAHDARVRMGELLDRLGLAAKRDTLASCLSGGEAQRVAVARALVRSPELILADEPTGAQDRDFTWSLMEHLLRANASGATVVVATHDREIVRRVRKRCANLRDGRIQLEEASCFL